MFSVGELKYCMEVLDLYVCMCVCERSQSQKWMLCAVRAVGREGDSSQLGLSDPGTLRAVSPRIAPRKWNTLYPWSPAGQL